MSIVAVRELRTSDFGTFTVVFTTYLLLLGISRSLATEPLVVRFSASDESVARVAIRDATGSALVIGLIGGVGCVAASAVLKGDAGRGLLMLGVGLPGLMLQDAWRYSFFAVGRPRRAAANDLLWALVQFPALAIVTVVNGLTVTGAILAWSAGATAAAAFGALQWHMVPKPERTLSWLAVNRDLGPRFSAEFLAVTGTSSAAGYGVVAVAGLSALGTLGSGQLLFSPLNVVFLGAGAAALPELVRLRSRQPERLGTACVLLSIGLAVVPGLLALCVLGLPGSVGRSLLGEGWAPARHLLLPVAAGTMATGALIGPILGLRSLEAAGRSLSVRLATAPLALASILAGAATAGAYGAAVGGTLSVAITALVAWTVFWRELLARTRSASSPVASVRVNGAS